MEATAHRAQQNCGQIIRYAIATGRAGRDPTADLKGALPPVKKNHFAAIIEPRDIGALLRSIADYKGSFVIRRALKLAPLLFVRLVNCAKPNGWSDLERAEWRIPAERMKMKEPHIVPLPTQALDILRELHPLTGNRRYLFPSPRTDTRPCPTTAFFRPCGGWATARTK